MEPVSTIEFADAIKVVVLHKWLDTGLMNVIRHGLMADVPILAVEKTLIKAYNGPLETEHVTHKFGYMPIRWSAAGDAPPLDGSASCSFVVDAVADPDSTKVHWATSEDVVCCTEFPGRASLPSAVSYRSDAERALAKWDRGYQLAPLHPGQKLHAVGFAVAATARDRDARWCAGHARVEEVGSVPRSEATGYAPTCPTAYRITFTTTGAVDPKRGYLAALAAVEARLRAYSRIA